MDVIYSFFTGNEWFVYVAIFLAKIVEISFSTMRNILINKGFRVIAFLTGLVEIFVWLFVASAVLTDLKHSPLKALPYGFGFAFGVVAGSVLENWLAFGLVSVQIISGIESAAKISDYVREKRIGVTELEAHGFKGEKKLILFLMNRKGLSKLLKELSFIAPEAMFSVNDVKSVKGGTIPARKSFCLK